MTAGDARADAIADAVAPVPPTAECPACARAAFRSLTDAELAAWHRRGLAGDLWPVQLEALAREYERRGLLP